MKAWQRGYPLDLLREIKAAFDYWDDGLCLGAFTKVKENRIADWLAKGQLVWADGVAIASHRLTRPSPVRDFTGDVRATLPAGTLVVDRFAALPGSTALAARLDDLITREPLLAIHGWVEHPEDWEQLIPTLGWPIVKIRASSELVGLWTCPTILHEAVPERESWGIRPLGLTFDPDEIADEIADGVTAWADHYSSYNVRHSWTAVGLRTFGADPEFIEKPAEMSKGWKADHPDALAWTPQWTSLADRLPSVRALAEQLPARLERVRLMRLAPESGELTRHADITDPDAGTNPGKLLRIHFPIETNPAVEFRTWGLDGQIDTVHMTTGQAWYLDTRKPHAARNAGQSERIHLVVDAWSTPHLLDLLA